MSDRRPSDPKVGPADSATRRREIERHIREAAAQNKRPIDYSDTTRDTLPPSGANPHRELRRGPRGKTIMENVDDTQ